MQQGHGEIDIPSGRIVGQEGHPEQTTAARTRLRAIGKTTRQRRDLLAIGTVDTRQGATRSDASGIATSQTP